MVSSYYIHGWVCLEVYLCIEYIYTHYVLATVSEYTIVLLYNMSTVGKHNNMYIYRVFRKYRRVLYFNYIRAYRSMCSMNIMCSIKIVYKRYVRAVYDMNVQR